MSPTTLVLLPGLEGSGTLFANLLPELPQEIKVIVAAYPKRHFLPYAELVSWLEEIVPKHESFVLLGESYGSTLAVMFAAAHPANLAGVILSAGFISNPVQYLGVLPRLLANPFFFRFHPPDFLLNYFLTGPHAPRSLLLAVRQAQRSVSARVLADRAQAVLHCDATREIREVRVPLLYLQATEDNLVHKSSLNDIKRLHPQTISVPIPAPHLLLQREPRLAVRAITQFLETEVSNCIRRS